MRSEDGVWDRVGDYTIVKVVLIEGRESGKEGRGSGGTIE